MIAALAVKASVPFAAWAVADADPRWRGALVAAYVAALAALAGIAVGPDAIVDYLYRFSALIGEESVAGFI